MFGDPRNREPVINDDFGDDLGDGGAIGGGIGGGIVVPPPDDPPPPTDTTPPIIGNLTISPSTINLSSQNPSAIVTITANIYDLESVVTNVNLNGLGATSIKGFLYTWEKTYYYSSYSSGTHTQNLVLTTINSKGLTSSDIVNLNIIVESETVKDTTAHQINSFTVNDNTVSLN